MIPGTVYGSWTVVESTVIDNKSLCFVDCECGNRALVPSYDLRSGRSGQCKDCGLKNREYSYDEEQFVATKVKQKYRDYRKGAKERGYEFDLDLPAFRTMILSPCRYCEREWSNVIPATRWRPDFRYNGIDRIDNTLGYTADNCVPCCVVCNQAKKAMTYDQWVDWVARLTKAYSNWRK